MNQTHCCIFSAPLLSRIVCYFYHCPSFYFPCVFQIYLPLTRGSKKLRRETAGIMKRMFSALWLPVDSGGLALLISLLLLQLLSKLTRQYIRTLISVFQKNKKSEKLKTHQKILLNRIFCFMLLSYPYVYILQTKRSC